MQFEKPKQFLLFSLSIYISPHSALPIDKCSYYHALLPWTSSRLTSSTFSVHQHCSYLLAFNNAPVTCSLLALLSLTCSLLALVSLTCSLLALLSHVHYWPYCHMFIIGPGVFKYDSVSFVFSCNMCALLHRTMWCPSTYGYGALK